MNHAHADYMFLMAFERFLKAACVGGSLTGRVTHKFVYMFRMPLDGFLFQKVAHIDDSLVGMLWEDIFGQSHAKASLYVLYLFCWFLESRGRQFGRGRVGGYRC